ncbi:MAG: hypothetical protein A2Y33_09040 [Spirochaetes bacterium GWF1_51_8]|nr:MAG: hypothetical protein A2Y33_09040 [Spirochaetes bacterium GWF1_51_8]
MEFGNLKGLSAQDIYGFAIDFEQTGRELYDNIALIVKDPEIRELFKKLADAEEEHRKKFVQRLSEIKGILKYNSPDQNTQEIFKFFRSNMFSKEILSEKLRHLKDIESIFEFAMGLELDNVLFYGEIKRIVRIDEHEFLDEIIDDERAHFIHILQMKRAKE